MSVAVLLVSAAPRAYSQEPVEKPSIEDIRLGLGDTYKLGCWTPIAVELTGGTQSYTGRISVTVPDSDGVPTTVYSPDDRPVGVDPGQATIARLMVRVGQANSTIQIRFIANGEVLAERKFYSGPERSRGVVPGGVSATNRLMLEFGPSLGLGDLLQTLGTQNDLFSTRVVRVEEAAELPLDWVGYEGVDRILLTTSKPELYRPFMQNPGRIKSIRRWIELGGKLVLFCGSEAEELISASGPLAELVPGAFKETVQFREWQSLETFSGAERPKGRDSRLEIRVPQLMDVRGQILAHGGQQDTDLPLVVRTSMGFGEIIYVGMDFDRPPLLNWEGRNSFLRRVLNWNTNEEESNTIDQGLASIGSEDMIGELRNALDNKFEGVEVVPFALVALFVVTYILLIGPGDYFLVRRFLKRPELTWFTFPTIVILVSAAAYWYANWKKGDQLRLNQVEIVDVDLNSGLARGTIWSHFFTPQVDEYDLSVKPRLLGVSDLANTERQVAWLGLPGYSLGGMQASAAQTNVFQSGYSYSPALQSMLDLPVQVWSTKTITARWSATVDTPSAAELRRRDDGLLAGEISNNFGGELEDCLLLYGRWAYHFGRLAEGATIHLDSSQQPRTVKTSLTSATAGDTTITNTVEDGTVPYQHANSDVTRLAKTMMFFDAINGPRYTNKYNRYQSFVDLSHLLQQDNLAVLLARSMQPASQWLNGGEPLRSNDDRHWTYYRFVLPVGALADVSPSDSNPSSLP